MGVMYEVREILGSDTLAMIPPDDRILDTVKIAFLGGIHYMPMGCFCVPHEVPVLDSESALV
jgi:hypothetical protein